MCHKIFFAMTKHPTMISVTPSSASHIQYGIKHMSNMTPIEIIKAAMIRRKRQFAHNKGPTSMMILL